MLPIQCSLHSYQEDDGWNILWPRNLWFATVRRTGLRAGSRCRATTHPHTHIHEQRIFTPYYVRKIIWCSRPLKRQSIIISWCIKSYNNILNIRHFPFGIIENSCFSGNRPIMNMLIRFTGTRKNMYFLRFLERKKNQMPSTIIVVGYAYTIHMYSLYTNTKPRCRRLSKFVFLLHVFFFRCCVDIYTWTFYILIFLLVEEDAIEWSFCRKATFSVPRCYHSFIHSTFSLFLDNTAKKKKWHRISNIDLLLISHTGYMHSSVILCVAPVTYMVPWICPIHEWYVGNFMLA